MRSAHWWPRATPIRCDARHVLVIYAFLRFHGTSTAELAVAGQGIQVRAPSAAPDEGPAWVCCPGGEGDRNMRHGLRRHALVGVLVVAGMAAVAPGAWASITPTLTLDQSAGTAAGSTANLGVDLKFAPTGTDSPDALTLLLPPRLIAPRLHYS